MNEMQRIRGTGKTHLLFLNKSMYVSEKVHLKDIF